MSCESEYYLKKGSWGLMWVMKIEYFLKMVSWGLMLVRKTEHFLMKVSWGPMWVTSDYPIRAISLDVGGAKQGVERTSKYTCPNHSGYRRYLYHQGNEQTTGGTVEAAAKPRLIWRSAEIYFPGVSNLPLPSYHLILR